MNCESEPNRRPPRSVKELRVRIPVPEELSFLSVLLEHKVNRRSVMGAFLGWLLDYLFRDAPLEKVLAFAVAKAASYSLVIDGVVTNIPDAEDILKKTLEVRKMLEDLDEKDDFQTPESEDKTLSLDHLDTIPDLDDMTWD